jgi:integrase/recombinase XerC
MTKDAMMPKYEAGERACPLCSESLPAHQTWPGARYRFCGQPECLAIVKRMMCGRYIGPNEHKCDGDTCDNFVPQGRYRAHPAYLSCSAECWYRRSIKGNLAYSGGCGQVIPVDVGT